MATIDPDRSPPLRLNSIPAIDLRLLSQSELHSLSNSSSDLNRCDDVVIPKIDRSVFNESAGSRKQTYSRLRLAPPESSTIHRRTRLRASHALSPAADIIHEPGQPDNSQIVCVLKELFKSDSDSTPIVVHNHTNVVLPGSLHTEPLEPLNTTKEPPESLETEAPASLDTEATGTEVPASSNTKAGSSFASLETEAPALDTKLDTEAGASLDTKTGVSLETEAPASGASLETEAPALDTKADASLATEAGASLDTTTGASLETEAPATLDTKSGASLETEAPALNTKADASLDNEAEAPAALLNTKAGVLLETEASASLDTEAHEQLNTEAPEQLKNINAPELLNMKAPPEVLSTEALEFMPELLNEEVAEMIKTETKRKRGRPRKEENAVSNGPPAAKRMRNGTVKKEVVYDEDRDREIVNSRGVEINLRDLGRLEDPYGPEIRMRTEGLSTANELLGFMRGLYGQWGTTRKKRRVVDASEFGDALPKGWRLSLCIKKKEGHVWLFCRRYISPSGRQFQSCKDISMYLLSLHGEENMDTPSHINSNNSDDSALKVSSVNAANLYVQEDLKRDSPVHNPSTPPIALPTGCEKQSTSGTLGPIDVHVADVFKCLKCFLIFERKDDLFDHKSLCHKDEKCQLGSTIPDWSIVVGGIFGCNICHKTFLEINQYNGHIGTHVTNENRTTERTVDPVSITSEIDHNMSFGMESKKIDEAVHDLDMNEDVLFEESGDGIRNKCIHENNVPETDKDPDVSVSRSECDLDQDIVGRSSGDDSGSETRVQSPSICEEKGFQANTNDTRVRSSFDKLTDEQDKVVHNESSSGFFHGISNGQDAVSETRVHTSSICEEKGFRENINDMHMSSSFDDLTSEKGKVVNNESSSGFFHDISNVQDAVSETRVRTSSICEEKGYQENINGMHMPSSFDELTFEKGKILNNKSSSGVFHGISDGQEAVSETRVQTSSICEERGFRQNINDTRIFSPVSELASEKGKAVNKDLSSGGFHNRLGIDEGRFSETKKLSESEGFSLFSNTFKIAAADNSSLRSSKKQDSFQKSGLASVDQVAHVFDENRFSYGISGSKFDEQYGVRNSEFDTYQEKEPLNKEYIHIENDNKSGEANLDEFQVFRTNESINNGVVSLGSSSQNGLNANVMDFNTGKNIEFSSLVPPANNQAFGFQDGLKFDDIFGDKFDENIQELSLAFGNPNSLYEDTISVNAQKKAGLNCSPVVSSKINHTFDVETDLSMVNNSMVQDLKRGNESRGFQNNGNSVYSGRTWGDFKSDEFRISEDKKFMMGSGSNQMWKTPQGNHLQSGLVNPHGQIQAPNFHSFDIMSQKAQDGLFKPNERYNPSRSEPVEFRFLTDRSEHNPHALQSGSRIFPYTYNTGIEQGFDSTFWMGKNAMMPNMSGRNVITSVCTWCRNQFHISAMAFHQQTQAGVGSLCPNCSAGISGQANML